MTMEGHSSSCYEFCRGRLHQLLLPLIVLVAIHLFQLLILLARVLIILAVLIALMLVFTKNHSLKGQAHHSKCSLIKRRSLESLDLEQVPLLTFPTPS